MYKITKNGVAVDPKLYMIDEANQTFTSSENDLVLDFAGEDSWIFRIKYGCTITTGNHCFIDAWDSCIITVGERCTIDSGSDCNITVGDQTSIRAHGNSVITGGENCVVTRNDTNEVIRLVAKQTIKLNSYMSEGYEVVKPIETIEIGGLKFNKEVVEDFLKNLKPIN